MTKILIVEDDKDIAEMIDYNLAKEGYHNTVVYSGFKALEEISKKSFDLVVLDIMLPEKNGLDICKEIRSNEKVSQVPIIFLTAKSQEIDKILGLELGADDYMTKPFSPRELIARIKAILRRVTKKNKKNHIDNDLIKIDILKHKVTVLAEIINLTATEFNLLIYLASNQGIVLSRDKILSNVFGYESVVYDRTIDTHIKTLRKKLGKAKNYIETVRGIGYRFKEKI